MLEDNISESVSSIENWIHDNGEICAKYNKSMIICGYVLYSCMIRLNIDMSSINDVSKFLKSIYMPYLYDILENPKDLDKNRDLSNATKLELDDPNNTTNIYCDIIRYTLWVRDNVDIDRYKQYY